MEQIGPWLWIAAIAVIFWLLIIRPASKRQKDAAALQARLSEGDDVMLTSGIFGTIVGRGEDHLEVEVSPGVTLQVVPGAVASVRQTADDVVADEEPDSTTGGDEPTDPTTEGR